MKLNIMCALLLVLLSAAGVFIYILKTDNDKLSTSYNRWQPYMSQRASQLNICVSAAQKLYQPLLIATAQDPYANNQSNVNAFNASLTACKAQYPLPN